MIRNYLKTALRNLRKHRIFSFINITGLSVGMTACFLIFLYVSFELSYDSFHTKADRIYRLTTTVSTPTETFEGAITNYPNGPNIKHDFPEVASFVRVADVNLLVKQGDLKINEPHGLAVDSSFFQVFDFGLVQGDPRTALIDPFSVVLSERAAKKYFGTEDPMGRELTLPTGDTVLTVRITGLMHDMPANSQIKGDLLISMSTLTEVLEKESAENWTNHYPSTYLLLNPGADPRALEAKLPDYLERHIGSLMKELQMHYTLRLYPLKEVYLHFGNYRYAGQTGNVVHVYIFGAVALLILLTACFNFVNLSTARAVERAREVGIRKVVGAARGQLTRQFIGESLLVSLIAVVLAIVFSSLLLPLFNQLAGKVISDSLFSNPGALLALCSGALGVGLLAGIYPAWVLSSFKPVKVLKGGVTGSGPAKTWLRKGLVAGQFTLSLALIAATLTVYKQMDYMRSQQLGFRKDQVLVINGYEDRAQEIVKEAITNLPGVRSASLSSSVPGGDHTSAYSEIENVEGALQQSNVDLYFVDFDYFDLYNLEMAAGRSFSREFGTDATQAMVLNEAAVAMLGYSSPQQAIGRRFKQWGHEGRIIGVVKDFHYHSLQTKIQPLSMRIDPSGFQYISVNLAGGDIRTSLNAIKKVWEAQVPDKPFTYEFLDDSFDNQYRGEQRFGSLFFYFSVLAIFISCLGMLGLVAYSTVQRTKEIGVRKVLGASATSVVALISRDFLKLAGIAAVIAVPLVWYIMDRWLTNFAYRTPLSWWIFALSAALMLMITLATIGFHAVKAALMNPVDTLRNE
ncbi:ABC transporter permease [Parapedobacter lycopersici]|uniref:ABC transporter permease n=1 Tax=Parapedobacter lycopersici TaxID=1864939 RepID=UPI0033425918